MEVHIRKVSSRRELRRFIFLPERIHAFHKNWVPPLYFYEWSYFTPSKNRAFFHCETTLLLALRGQDVVGRVMGIINKRYNQFRGERTARFAYLESWEDPEVVSRLLGYVEEWAKEKGMNRVIGPYGFSDQDPEGFLIEGFAHPPTISTYYNFDWMPRLVEGQGYVKDVDYVNYRIEISRLPSEHHRKMYERVLRRGSLQTVSTRGRRDARLWARPAFRLMNESYARSHIYGFAPLDEGDMEMLLQRYLPILDPRFLKGVRKDNELVGFVIGIPDMMDGIRRARGRLLPLGFLKILRAKRKTRQLDLLLGAINEEYRGLGADVLMMVEMGLSAQKAGMLVVDTHHQLEENKKVRAVSEWLGGKICRRYRVYQKAL